MFEARRRILFAVRRRVTPCCAFFIGDFIPNSSGDSVGTGSGDGEAGGFTAKERVDFLSEAGTEVTRFLGDSGIIAAGSDG